MEHRVTMRRTTLHALVCALLSAIPIAQAEVVLDQEYVVGSSGSLNYYLDYPGDHLAQTFTVGNSGTLTGIGVQVSLTVFDRFHYVAPIDDLHISVVQVDENGFALVNEVLAKGTIVPSSLQLTQTTPGRMTVVDVSSWNAKVSAGDQLAIAFASGQTDHSGPEQAANYMWFRSTRDVHPDGQFSIYSPKLYGATPLWDFRLGPEVSTSDAGFSVYIDVVPEMSIPAILIFGGAALCIRRRQANKHVN
jgi:hypothetical protein